MDEFQKDLARVVEIAKIRTAIFDADDDNFSSAYSKELYREYRELRRKYSGDYSECFYAAYNNVWETA